MSDQINVNGKPNKARIVCAITGKELSRNGAAHLDAVRPSLVERMRRITPISRTTLSFHVPNSIATAAFTSLNCCAQKAVTSAKSSTR